MIVISIESKYNLNLNILIGDDFVSIINKLLNSRTVKISQETIVCNCWKLIKILKCVLFDVLDKDI